MVPALNDPLISDQTPIWDHRPPALTFFLSNCTPICDHTLKRDQRPLFCWVLAKILLPSDRRLGRPLFYLSDSDRTRETVLHPKLQFWNVRQEVYYLTVLWSSLITKGSPIGLQHSIELQKPNWIAFACHQMDCNPCLWTSKQLIKQLSLKEWLDCFIIRLLSSRIFNFFKIW